jgi:hypothetical protein
LEPCYSLATVPTRYGLGHPRLQTAGCCLPELFFSWAADFISGWNLPVTEHWKKGAGLGLFGLTLKYEA